MVLGSIWLITAGNQQQVGQECMEQDPGWETPVYSFMPARFTPLMLFSKTLLTFVDDSSAPTLGVLTLHGS